MANMIDYQKLSKEKLQNLLYERLEKEYNEFIEDLKKLPPEEIIEESYKKVIRDDIIMSFEGDDVYLDKEQLIALLKCKHPLYECYEAWMDTDYSYMDMLRDAISQGADKLINIQAAA
ncbi:MAG: DUF3848 domain-containing protein [Clostridia bacterium]|nr:DUF3848 domain-containing protein [Clostridia bacterium]MCI8979425.1 DUF3848 domain-containing protein [Clostridia bacterium]MCI9086709.1 DUF3848 domain-containing protein [Clostridia bacterium]NDO20312.1 DUF3848 domain-containing protein [Lachnospiraceae bacterium MD329]